MRCFVRGAVFAVAGMAVVAAPAAGQIGPMPGFSPSFGQVDKTGSHVVFATSEPLARTDTDGPYSDVYVWSADGGLHHVSTGGNGPHHARSRFVADDGERVIFETPERLSGADGDDWYDLYAWSEGDGVELVSTGPDDPSSGSPQMAFSGASRDARRVLFTQLPPVIAGPGAPLFERFRDVTRQLATEPVDPADAGGWFNVDQITPDAKRILGSSLYGLVPEDTDEHFDAYEISTSSKEQVSLASRADRNPNHIWPIVASEDLEHVLLETDQSLEPGDGDNRRDVYLRSNGRTRLVSGPAAGLVERLLDSSKYDAFARAVADDGSKATFVTSERLTSEDRDAQFDVYAWSATSGIELVSTAPGDGSTERAEHVATSPDGSRILFGTYGRLTSGDVDDVWDIYERSGGVTRLLTPGTADRPVEDVGIPRDLSHVYFVTAEGLVPEDTDGRLDVYDAGGAAVTLVSTGPTDGGTASLVAGAPSRDGSAYVWETSEPLVPEDDDDPAAPWEARNDLYVRSGGVTRLVTPDP